MNWDLRHRKSALVIRLLLAVWIAVIVIVLCATGRWWGLVFVGGFKGSTLFRGEQTSVG
jgi:hypothetical protein